MDASMVALVRDNSIVKLSGPLPLLACLAPAVAGLAIGGLLMLGSWHFADARAGIDHAPTCADDQVFTTADCRATLDGTVVKLTHERLDLSVEGRQVAMVVSLGGETTGNEGVPVHVTFYRGKPIHVEGSSLYIDAEGSPATVSWNLSNAAWFFVIVGPIFTGISLVIWLIVRANQSVTTP
jgi:hypothetical protein